MLDLYTMFSLKFRNSWICFLVDVSIVLNVYISQIIFLLSYCIVHAASVGRVQL